jgi:hypothetical protein
MSFFHVSSSLFEHTSQSLLPRLLILTSVLVLIDLSPHLFMFDHFLLMVDIVTFALLNAEKTFSP